MPRSGRSSRSGRSDHSDSEPSVGEEKETKAGPPRSGRSSFVSDVSTEEEVWRPEHNPKAAKKASKKKKNKVYTSDAIELEEFGHLDEALTGKPGGKDVRVDMSAPPFPAKPPPPGAKPRDLELEYDREPGLDFQVPGTVDEEYAYEGLGRGEEDLSWIPPSRTLAISRYRRLAFERGRAPLWKTGTFELLSLGGGITLYFRMVKYMAFALVLWAALTLPALSFVSGGGGTSDPDPMRASDESLNSFPSPAMAAAALEANQTEPTVSFAAQTYTLAEGSELIYQLDVAGTVLFFIAFLVYVCMYRRVKRQLRETAVTPANYTVFATGIPGDATPGEVRRHFSDLFQLSDPDWESPGYCFGLCCRKKSRPPMDAEDSGDVLGGENLASVDPIDPCRPVTDVSNTEDEDYMGSWVAEVSPVHKDSDAVFAALERAKINIKLRDARATVKKYSVDTPYKGGPNQMSKLKALKQVEILTRKYDKLSAKLGGAETAMVGAFVTFNNEESYLRCLKDYRGSTSWYIRMMQARPLRLRARHPLTVVAAKEPHDLLWQHLDAHVFVRWARVALVWLLYLLLFGALFMGTWGIETVRHTLRKVAPVDSLCKDHLLAHEYGQYIPVPHTPALVRVDGNGVCTNSANVFIAHEATNITEYAINPSMLATYGITGVPDAVWRQQVLRDRQNASVITFNQFFNITTGTVNETLPTNQIWGPCFDTSSDPNTFGSVLACNTSLSSPHHNPGWLSLGTLLGFPWGCYPSSMPSLEVVNCFCHQELKKEVDSQGVSLGFMAAMSGGNSDICSGYYLKWYIGELMPHAPILYALVANYIMYRLAFVLTDVEYHLSKTSAQMSIMVKLIASAFMIIAVLPIATHGKLPNGGQFPSIGLPMFEGTWDSFNDGWYLSAGWIIFMTTVLNTWGPMVIPLIKMFVLGPLDRKCCSRRSVTQRSLDLKYTGNEFHLGERLGVLFASLFLQLSFAPMYPLLVPFAALYLVAVYWMEKFMMLRWRLRPVNYYLQIPAYAGWIWLWLIVFHAMGAAYAYGDPTVLTNTEYDGALTSLVDNVKSMFSAYDSLKVLDQSTRSTSMFFGLVALLGSVLLIIFGLFRTKIALLFRGLGVGLSLGLCCRRNNAYKYRKFLPPYTNDFVRELDPATEFELYDDEIEAGWTLETSEQGRQLMSKIWLEDGDVDGIPHIDGDRKRTWEVLRDQGLHTYDIGMNPKYKAAVLGTSDIL